MVQTLTFAKLQGLAHHTFPAGMGYTNSSSGPAASWVEGLPAPLQYEANTWLRKEMNGLFLAKQKNEYETRAADDNALLHTLWKLLQLQQKVR